jgi:hypothetical protein
MTYSDRLVLPSGPGLAARWSVALPLMLVSTVLPIFGALTLNAWTSVSFDLVLDGPNPSFWHEFWDDADSVAGALVVPAIALVVFLVWRTMFAVWPKVCLWTSVWLLGPGLLISSVIDDGDDLLPNLALGVGLIWLNYELGRLTLWVLSRPVARDLVSSALEIPYQVPGSRVRLRVKRNRLVLDRLTSGNRTTREVIPWSELRSARLEELDEPTSWRAGSATVVEVPVGPVLRVTGGDTWLIPVTEAMGEDLAAAITLRARDST